MRTSDHDTACFLKMTPAPLIGLSVMGFESDPLFEYPPSVIPSEISGYGEVRDFPGIRGTSLLGIHLRFGTISIRQLAAHAQKVSAVFLNELIWRDFFQQILWHFPEVVDQCFRPQYENLPWRNNEEEFDAWCNGMTGYPMVDAGMRELNATGFMHNRVRMVVAGFLTKHLLIDWRWGEAYFAGKLLDFELASNNGNWQWAAGTGCDAAPYFRIFNPTEQARKFDPAGVYLRKWIPELGTSAYPSPIVDHKEARVRALNAFRGIASRGVNGN
jgi:deoxyribodipyrimidine photo-lyase